VSAALDRAGANHAAAEQDKAERAGLGDRLSGHADGATKSRLKREPDAGIQISEHGFEGPVLERRAR
jgi:hypothetical protein